MRTKTVDGWQRKDHFRLSVMKTMKNLRQARPGMIFGMILLTGLVLIHLHLHLRQDSSQASENTVSGYLPGTVRDDQIFQCDRSQWRTDICNLRGDVQLEICNGTKAFVLYANQAVETTQLVRKETTKPYSRKWEEDSMSSVNEVTLLRMPALSLAAQATRRPCDVRHKVPGIVFSTAGYTGNLYHEFNDGIIPLFITSQHLRREAVLIISSFHNWWYSKYREVIEQITKYEIIDLERDERVHCFPEIETGLHIHGELSIDANRMPLKEGIQEFRDMLNRAYKPGPEDEHKIRARLKNKINPRLTIIVRQGTRKLLNLDDVIHLAERIGFKVHLLTPDPTMELKKIFSLLNNTDVLLGVHGAAMTHFLFMRPGSVFIQIVPLGTDWAANEYFGEPVSKLGLKYMPYKIQPDESSLSDIYNATDPVLVDPDRITQRGWGDLKKIYLEAQDVRPSLHRLRQVLQQAKQDCRPLSHENNTSRKSRFMKH